MRTVAAVVAVAAVGERDPAAAATAPDVLAPLAGQPVIRHSIAAFESAPGVDEILVAVPPALAGRTRQLAAEGGSGKVSRVIEAGGTRSQAVWQVIEALGETECGLLIHDAARPLVSQRVIEDCVGALGSHQAVCAVVPASDTMVVVTGGLITQRPQRDRLRRRQTPQGFRLPVIRRGYELAFADPAFAEPGPGGAGPGAPADDCGVVLRYLPGVPVRLVPGSEQTFRITRMADIEIAETMLGAGLP